MIINKAKEKNMAPKTRIRQLTDKKAPNFLLVSASWRIVFWRFGGIFYYKLKENIYITINYHCIAGNNFHAFMLSTLIGASSAKTSTLTASLRVG